MAFPTALPLSPGSIVDVIAPGMSPAHEVVRAAQEFLQGWGLTPRIPKDLLGRDLLCANSDEKRMRQLKTALTNPDSSLIWCMRGGYGSIRLLPELAKLKKPKQTKCILGLSDITSLQLFVGQAWQWPSLHGPHLDRLAQGQTPAAVARELKQVLFGEKKSVRFTGLKLLNSVHHKTIRAPVSGGNMVTVQSSLATPYQIQTRGRILFLEEIGERGYKVDRILVHLEQAGLLRGVRAVVLGTFVGGAEPDGRMLARQVVKRWAQSQTFPVYWGMPCGHARVQRVLPMHTMAELKDGVLEVATGIGEAL